MILILNETLTIYNVIFNFIIYLTTIESDWMKYLIWFLFLKLFNLIWWWDETVLIISLCEIISLTNSER